MKAITISGLGGVEVLVAAETPIPPLGLCDILVSVKAVTINPVDAKIRCVALSLCALHSSKFHLHRAGKWAIGNLPVRRIMLDVALYI